MATRLALAKAKASNPLAAPNLPNKSGPCISKDYAPPLCTAVVAAAGITVLSQSVVTTTLTRVGLLACIAATALALKKHPRRLAAFLAILAIPSAAVAFWQANGRIPAEEEGRRAARAALNYEGVEYVRGGESSRGIDCSGLIRRAYIDATLATAWRDASPAHLRRAINWWWRDTTAREFENKPPVNGRRLAETAHLHGPLPASLRPGDVAIVAAGAHVLLYLGDNRWIQADPSEHRVVVNDAAKDDNIWLDGSAVLLRPTP